MIVIDGQDILISHGDTLDVIFKLAEGYKVAETDTIPPEAVKCCCLKQYHLLP